MKGKVLLSGDPGGKLKKLSLVVFIVLSVVVFGSQQVPAIEFFAGGMTTPETISPAPGGAFISQMLAVEPLIPPRGSSGLCRPQEGRPPNLPPPPCP